MAREVLGTVGAVVGGIYYGPQGAQIGYMIGSTIGGWIDSKNPEKGPGLGEAPIQTGRDNIPIPRIWGIHECHGNLMQVNPFEEYTTTEGGKGGGGVEVDHRRQTFAIGVCEGPIVSIRRIWENNRLVYDVGPNQKVEDDENAKYIANCRIYLGTETQLPDPDLEAYKGVGYQPYYRGTAYIVWVDYEITDFGSSIPQYRFEVVASLDASLTSRPYPVDAQDAVQGEFDIKDITLLNKWIEGVDITALTPQSGTLVGQLTSLDYQLPEGVDITAVTPQSGTLLTSLLGLDYQLPEGVDITAVTPIDGTLVVELIPYENWPAEGVDVTAVTPIGGTLT